MSEGDAANLAIAIFGLGLLFGILYAILKEKDE